MPFVDVLSTMSDPSLPLTVIEYEEWGNPGADLVSGSEERFGADLGSKTVVAPLGLTARSEAPLGLPW